jgi:hypothetical protein
MFRKPRSFNKIISGFSKTLSELENLIEANAVAAQKTSDKILKLQMEENDLINESVSATAFKENLQKLLGVTP